MLWRFILPRTRALSAYQEGILVRIFFFTTIFS